MAEEEHLGVGGGDQRVGWTGGTDGRERGRRRWRRRWILGGDRLGFSLLESGAWLGFVARSPAKRRTTEGGCWGGEGEGRTDRARSKGCSLPARSSSLALFSALVCSWRSCGNEVALFFNLMHFVLVLFSSRSLSLLTGVSEAGRESVTLTPVVVVLLLLVVEATGPRSSLGRRAGCATAGRLVLLGLLQCSTLPWFCPLRLPL